MTRSYSRPTAPRRGPVTRRIRGILFVAAIATAALGVAPTAQAATAPFTYTADPVTGRDGSVIVERVAPRAAGLSPTWRMNLDLIVKNNSRSSQTVTRIDVAYPGSTITTKVVTGLSGTVAAGASAWLTVPETRMLPFPLPSTVKVTLYWSGFDPQSVTYPLYLRENNTPTGGYRFPALLKAAGQYWSVRNTQDIGSGHRAFRPQKFAYDLGISRWDGSQWVGTRDSSVDPDPNTLTNDDFLVFGTPLYAIHDGTIFECRSDFTDNYPGVKGFAGGNSLWIDLGNGEIVLYAHLKAGSMPSGLCPVQSKTSQENGGNGAIHAQPVTIKEGQFLGRVGNTGRSGGPHLHIHLQDKRPLDWVDGNDAAGAQALPLLFDHVKIRGLSSTMTGFDPTDPSALGFANITAAIPASLPSYSLTNPNSCGWKVVTAGLTEVERHAVSAACFGEILGDATVKGYRPVFFDVYDIAGKTYTNMVMRPSGGVAWKAYAGITGATLQSTYTSLVGAGYRLLQVESFLEGGAPRYDAIFTKEAGPAFAMFYGLDELTANNKHAQLTSLGYHPVNESVVSVNGVRSYTGLWIKSDVGNWALATHIPASQYASSVQSAVNGGVKQIYVNTYVHNGELYFCSITVTKASSDWVSLFGLTSSGLTTAGNEQRAAGRLTLAEAGYSKSGVAAFAGVWMGQ